MGLRLQDVILAFLRLVFSAAFWPKVDIPSDHPDAPAAASSNPKVVYPEGLQRGPILALDDLNGTTRGLLLGTVESRARWAAQAKQMQLAAKMQSTLDPHLKAARAVDAKGDDDDADESDEEGGPDSPAADSATGSPQQQQADPDAPPALERPSDLKEYLFNRYGREFFYYHTTEVNCVWDFIGATPRVKEIMAGVRFSRPVVWPADRATLFSSNAPFQNTIHEYFADREAKELLYQYLTEALLDEFPYSGRFPEGCSLVVWGGVYCGERFRVPRIVSRMHTTGVRPQEPLQPRDGLDVLCAEADVCIGAIVRWCIGRRTVKLMSRDTDFIPILMYHYAEALALATTIDGAPDPLEHGVFISRKQLIKFRVPKQPAAAAMVVDEPPAPHQAAPAAQDDDDSSDDPLSFLKPQPPPVRHIPSLFAKPAGNTQQAAAAQLLLKKAATARGAKKADDGCYEDKGYIREVIDIGELCRGLWAVLYNYHGKCQRCNPISIIVAIMFLCGCDYIKKPNLLQFKDLLGTYIAHHARIGCLCPRDKNTAEAPYFRIDYTAFTRLLAVAYVVKNKLKVSDPYNYGAVAALLRQRKEAADAAKASSNKPPPKRAPVDRLPPVNPAGLCARLCFTVNHYLRTAKQPPLSGLEKDPSTGRSLYGYAENAATGRCMFTDDVSPRKVY